ncbi:ParE toxin of type II toxin-antitoxin system, parDE [Acididesulfobacillus acetoxydans]|uniref:ParE toxin of type II toxin-antitoxin system, parDE n=1 Tax=Acididesulfobacillus acetoxydans TaxID=1561005 RepID=A0A8S0WE47_9FIRM|nr:type II toxin-antitoxin system RelE/ParE family toxin [Acididesulfobacillus acetoxydans]CAA7599852.1 ParE toxin of type II toxin-antitoxin system, parDE [Acididesulfobacillus acetoxydans]CEJ07418.1 Plasmid stabilization system protein [Acididesulfobacillus acetoxydans]
MENKYSVKLLPRAYCDLDGIYEYIAETLREAGIAAKLIDSFEEAILSLESMPRRGALRKTGAYANKGYRQLFVGHFTVVYRVAEAKKRVLVVTIRYSKSQF